MSNELSSTDLITAFRKNHRSAIAELYNRQRDHFLIWAKKRFDCAEATFLDVFQDAIIVLYQNVMDGKIEKIEGSPEAYLFGIARNLLLKRSQQEKRIHLSESISEDWIKELDFGLYNRIEADHQKQMIENAFSQLQESCRKLLELFYYKRYSIESIQIALDYSSLGTVKTRKVQCLQSLRTIFNNLPLV